MSSSDSNFSNGISSSGSYSDNTCSYLGCNNDVEDELYDGRFTFCEICPNMYCHEHISEIVNRCCQKCWETNKEKCLEIEKAWKEIKGYFNF